MDNALANVVRPQPVMEGLAKEFYDGCGRGELRFQRCTRCGTFRHIPRELCAECGCFDWEWAREVPRERLVVAGGLTPENVAAAVRALRPFAVDVASGVESAPGIKDPARMAALVAHAKAA